MLQKEKQKCRHDAVVHNLPVVPVDATVSYIDKDLKTWSIGRVESHDGRSYVVATEDGQLVSHNQVHLHKTNLSFGMPTTSISKPFVPRLDMPSKPSNTINNTGPSPP